MTMTSEAEEGDLGMGLYERIKAEITSLRLPPGTPVQEASLGERFGVSRTPAREVLQRLQRHGLVERIGRFWRVITLTEREVRELCELREALECLAARRAAANAAGIAAILTPLVEAEDRALTAGDYDRAGEIDTLFHLRIAERADNQELLRHLAMLHDRVALTRSMRRHRPSWHTGLITEHRRIVDALARGDAEIAAAEMRYHVRTIQAGAVDDLSAERSEPD